MLFSIIIPAYRAHGTILRAIESTFWCGISTELIEVIVAPDGAENYNSLPSFGPHINVIAAPPTKTGAGFTRNRAIAASKGEYLAFLDADDTWERDYLAAALPILREDGIVFGSTSVIAKEEEIIRFSGYDGSIDLAYIQQSAASFHPILRRSVAGPFREAVSQDVFHAVEQIAAHGGRCRILQEAYQLRINESSTTGAANFSEIADDAYLEYINEIMSGQSRIPNALWQEACRVFERKIAINREHRAISNSIGYYEFIAHKVNQAAAPKFAVKDLPL